MKLKEIRSIRNISQEQLATAIGVQSSAISKYETGRVPIPEDRLRQISQYLNVSINVLTSNDDIVLKSDGEIVSINQYVSSQSLGNISDGIYSDLVALFNKHDVDWQKKTLLKLKLLDISDSKTLDQIMDIMSSILLVLSVAACVCRISMLYI